jgi:hypothetical protein
MIRHGAAAIVIMTAMPAYLPEMQLITAWAGGTEQGRSIYNTTLGTPFTVGDADLSVTALGYYDYHREGLVNRHEIGIYDRSGTLLGSVSYTPGDPTFRLGQFSYMQLAAPIALAANSIYVLAATTTIADDRIVDGVTAAAVGAGIQTIYGTLSAETAELSFPATLVGRNLIFANFIAIQ